MTALAVVEHFDILKHRCLGLFMRIPGLQIEQFGLESVKETLYYGIIPTVTFTAHTRLYAVLGQEVPIALSTILTATIGMHDQPRCGLALTNRHHRRLIDQLCPHMVGT